MISNIFLAGVLAVLPLTVKAGVASIRTSTTTATVYFPSYITTTATATATATTTALQIVNTTTTETDYSTVTSTITSPITLTQVSTTTTTIALATTTLPYTSLPSQYSMLGCYEDTPDRQYPFRLDTDPSYEPSQTTADYCARKCSAAGYMYSATENSYQCFCGNNAPVAQLLPPTYVGSCGYTCAGDPLQTCGGWWALQVANWTGFGMD